MTLSDLFYVLPPRQMLAVVTALSIVLYTLAANLAWVLASRRPYSEGKTRWQRMLRWLQSAWIARGLGEIVRWLYYLGVPYATLMLGYNTVHALGIWNLDWLNTLPIALVLAAAAMIIFVWIWRPYARVQHPHAVDESRWNQARHILELLYQQAHWALYRSGPILWLGDPYWGSLIGLGLTYLEGWSSPYVRASAREITRADAPLWTGSLAVASTIVFIYTQNWWYCLAIHLLLDLGVRTLIGFPRVALAEQENAALLESMPPSEEQS